MGVPAVHESKRWVIRASIIPVTNRMSKLVNMVCLSGLSLILLPAFVNAQAQQPRAKANQKPLIGYIKDENLVDMCGCAYEHATRTRGYTFSSDGEVKEAWMNIDGVDVKLKRTHFSGSKGRDRIGSRYFETFEAEGIKVSIVRTVNRLCIPYNPDCETTGYDVRITVTKGGRSETVHAGGQCGCV